MSIFYKVTPTSNPAGEEGVDYAACRRTKSGDYDLDVMAVDISNAPSVTQADVKASSPPTSMRSPVTCATVTP